MPDEAPPPRLTPPGPTPEEVAARSFPNARRGLDPEAVRRYLGEVAAALRDARRREGELADRLAAAERAAAAPPRVDEATLTQALGAETARVLQSAHEAAREIVAKAERRASAIVADAESAVAERTLHAEREAVELLEHAREDAAAMLETTHEEARNVVAEARDARRRILTDLAERRRTLAAQVEQLRAGRNALNEVLDGVAGSVLASVDAIKHRLDHAEEQARLAAQTAAAESTAQPDELDLDLAALPEPAVPPIPPLRPTGGPGPDTEAHEPPAPPLSPEPAVAVPDEVAEVAEPVASGSGEAGGAEEATGEPGTPISATGGVDELFARIRESRQHDVAQARAERAAAEAALGLGAEPAAVPPPEAPGSDAAVPTEPVPETDAGASTAGPDPGVAPAPSRGARPAQRRGERRGEARTEAAAPSVPAAPSTALSIAVEDDDFQMLVRRDQLLAPATAELGRALKRTLRIEQNELLDAVRNLTRAEEAVALLPGGAMAERVASALRRGIEAAWAAGDAFVADVLGSQGPARLLDETERRQTLDEVGRDAALEVVEAIRRRMEVGLSRGGDEGGIASVGAAFRDWKGSRVDGLASDTASRAFARATLQASRSRGARVTWIVDDGEHACPDCDDNALAGVVAAGSDFPTGHAFPPIHPGCRCLVVPVQR